jgi:NADPH2:quinone reductase
MNEAIVRKDTSVNIVDSPLPKPGPGQVLTKVIVAPCAFNYALLVIRGRSAYLPSRELYGSVIRPL